MSGTLSSLCLLSATDIQNQRFERVWRGYEPAEVDRFLGLLAEQTDQLMGRVLALEVGLQQGEEQRLQAHRQVADLEQQLEAPDRAAAAHQQTLAAQAQALRQQAQAEAAQIVGGAQQVAEELSDQILGLRAQRGQLLDDLRGIVSTHARLLDVMESNLPGESLGDPEEAPEQGDPGVLRRLGAPPPPARRPAEILGAPPPAGA
jgi:cell division initiation protein